MEDEVFIKMYGQSKCMGSGAPRNKPVRVDGELLWTKQLGTDAIDRSLSIAVDTSGNAYISGDTYGDIGGPHVGIADAYLAKYDPEGNLLWTEQLGSSAVEICQSVTVDAFGNAWISGHTYGTLGGINAGYYDAYLAKYDTSGNLLWTEQLGTSVDDKSWSVAVDASSIPLVAQFSQFSIPRYSCLRFIRVTHAEIFSK